jgi:hypothetical protein
MFDKKVTVKPIHKPPVLKKWLYKLRSLRFVHRNTTKMIIITWFEDNSILEYAAMYSRWIRQSIQRCPEDGGDTHLWIVNETMWRSIPKNFNFHSRRPEYLKSHTLRVLLITGSSKLNTPGYCRCRKFKFKESDFGRLSHAHG